MPIICQLFNLRFKRKIGETADLKKYFDLSNYKKFSVV